MEIRRWLKGKNWIGLSRGSCWLPQMLIWQKSGWRYLLHANIPDHALQQKIQYLRKHAKNKAGLKE